MDPSESNENDGHCLITGVQLPVCKVIIHNKSDKGNQVLRQFEPIAKLW